MNKLPRYAPEVRERAVRMVLEHQSEYSSQWAAIGAVAAKIDRARVRGIGVSGQQHGFVPLDAQGLDVAAGVAAAPDAALAYFHPVTLAPVPTKPR